MAASNNNSEEIERILSAPNHYAVLGVNEDADPATIRKAYLRASVRVHPDKNATTDPGRATMAFQRVAHAWQVLSDENSRAEYDDAEACSSNFEQDNDTGNTTTPPSGPSLQDALLIFAAVTAMFAGRNGKASSDVAQTLFWAEKLVQQQRDGNTTTSSSSSTNKAHAAMAASSGLRAVSATAKALGFRKSAATLERTANLAQVAGLGAMIADTPAGKQALNNEKVRKLRGALSDMLLKPSNISGR